MRVCSDKILQCTTPGNGSPLAELLRYKGIVNHDAAVLIDALNLYAETTLDQSDCILAVHVRRGAGKLFSFDKALKGNNRVRLANCGDMEEICSQLV